MPGPIIATLCILAVVVIIVGAMWLGWRRRQRTQSHLPSPKQLPAGLGTPVFAVDDAHYVATSKTGNALDRIAKRPLAYRGRATVEVHPQGLALGIAGEEPFFIPTAQLETVAVAQATIDRAVERDGLIVVRWLLDPAQSVETYLRVVNPDERATLLTSIGELIEPSATTQETA
ncbi:PH-like domain-containing protein [Gulosibacter faecalis]|uniref:PH domain-containing protein n=1 Tax=Gulosibacter faecalis TaxID=272240 RepID=A0ABW5V0C2_9MICO|nr:hypothetical protein [Gulosibacter faecalis]